MDIATFVFDAAAGDGPAAGAGYPEGAWAADGAGEPASTFGERQPAQRAKGKEQRAKGKGRRAKSKEQRAKGKEQRRKAKRAKTVQRFSA